MNLALWVSALGKGKESFSMRLLKKTLIFLLIVIIHGMVSSCANYLNVKGIAYQSIRSKESIEESQIPQSAKIIVGYNVNSSGKIDVEILNNTDEIMTIDRTKSFFRDGNGNSTVYYDPTVNVLAQSTTSGHISGGSVNLGSVARAAGVGGVAGTLLSGVNVGGANENSTTTTNTTYIVDQPKISIAPHGKASMGRAFQQSNFGSRTMVSVAQHSTTDINTFFTSENYSSAYSCTITISYSIDDEKTYEKIETTLYANSIIVSHVKQTGYVNEALRSIYKTKSNLFDEEWYILCFGNNAWKYQNNVFYNYK